MLVASAVDQVADATTSLAQGLAMLWAHPQVRAEIVELLDVLDLESAISSTHWRAILKSLSKFTRAIPE